MATTRELHLFRLLKVFCLASLAWGAQLSSADEVTDAIVAYNQARESGETTARIAASIKLGDAALANKDNPNAVIMAFEAGQTLCFLKDCQGTAPYADWAATQDAEGAGLRAADVALLQAYAAWRNKSSGRTRNALNDALKPLVDTEPSLLSMVAFASRYQSDMAEGKWSAVRRSAADATVHFASDKDAIPTYYISAKATQTIADFVQRPSESSVLDFARLEVELELLDNQFGLTSDPAMAELYWLINAWRLATEAYTESVLDIPQRRVDEIKDEMQEILDGRPKNSSCAVCRRSEIDPDFDPETDLLPCDGRFDMKPALRYPTSAAWRGYVGAVLLRISVKGGRVNTVEPLASVPAKVFQDSAIETVKKWDWVPQGGVPGETCTADRSNIILPLIFVIG